MNISPSVLWLLKAYVPITLFLGLSFATTLLVSWFRDIWEARKEKDR